MYGWFNLSNHLSYPWLKIIVQFFTLGLEAFCQILEFYSNPDQHWNKQKKLDFKKFWTAFNLKFLLLFHSFIS